MNQFELPNHENEDNSPESGYNVLKPRKRNFMRRLEFEEDGLTTGT